MKCRELLSTGSQPPLARSSHSCTVVDDDLYVFGGENVPRVPIDNLVNVYDLKTGKWTVKNEGEAPPPTVGHSAYAANKKVYIFGGRSGKAMEEAYNHIYEYNTEDDVWRKVSATGELPDGRSFQTMTSIGSNAFLFGGCGEAGRYNDLHMFAPDKDEWKKLKSCNNVSPRGGAGLVAVDDCVYVIGGFNGDELNDMHCFNIGKEQWNEIKAEGLPATSVFAATSLNSIIYVFGGETEASPSGHNGAGKLSNNLFSYDTRDGSQSWIKRALEGRVPSPRGWLASSRWGDQFLVHGGNGEDNVRRDELYSIALS